MRTLRTEQFKEELADLPKLIQKKFDKQLNFLLLNLRHPSLHCKKFDEARGIWQARVDDHYRFYFIIDTDIYVLFNILRHLD
ncbi:MAG: type II toxin-antitoxin system RelE/ParE family toxin [Patescibacteria group bacterium]